MQQGPVTLRILAGYGISGLKLHDLERATTLIRLTSAWSGFAGQQEKFGSILKKNADPLVVPPQLHPNI